MSVNPVVSPSVKTPSVYISVNLKAGAVAPGSAPLKALILASKSSVGTITADTELAENVSAEDVKGLCGLGTPGYLATKRLFEEYPLAQVDLVAPAVNVSAVAATGVITFSGSPTESRTIRAYISGRRVEAVWAAGDDAQAGAEALRDAANALGAEMPIVATALVNGAGPDWDMISTFRVPGPIGNDCRVYVQLIGGAGGTVAAPAGNTLAGGTGEPDYTNAISILTGKEYDLILNCCSNADAQDGSSSSNPGRVKTDIDLRKTGGAAKLQQQVVGVTATLTDVKTGTGNINDEESQLSFCLAGQSLPAEFGGAEVGARLREESIDPAKNRIGMPYRARLFGAFDLSLDKPDETEIEDALNTGVSIITYADDGTLLPARPITTYHKDALGNPDARVLDVSIPTGVFAVAKDLRVALPQEYPQKKLSKNLEPGDDPPPPDVVEERDVQAFIGQRIRFWISRGVVRRDKWEEAIANETFVVQVNPSDPSQLDIVLPLSIVPPLAKFGIDVRHFRN